MSASRGVFIIPFHRNLGAHFDSYGSLVAHTLVVGTTADELVTGGKANVAHPTHTALQAAVHMIRSGKTNEGSTDTIDRIAEDHSKKLTAQNPSRKHCRSNSSIIIPMETCNIILRPVAYFLFSDRLEFSKDKVYFVDILVSTGDGRDYPGNSHTTIYECRDIPSHPQDDFCALSVFRTQKYD